MKIIKKIQIKKRKKKEIMSTGNEFYCLNFDILGKDLISVEIKVDHSDLYFMVQRFCLISKLLFDV